MFSLSALSVVITCFSAGFLPGDIGLEEGKASQIVVAEKHDDIFSNPVFLEGMEINADAYEPRHPNGPNIEVELPVVKIECLSKINLTCEDIESIVEDDIGIESRSTADVVMKIHAFRSGGRNWLDIEVFESSMKRPLARSKAVSFFPRGFEERPNGQVEEEIRKTLKKAVGKK